MYVNNALRNPLEQPPKPWANNFSSGGPSWDVIDIYKAAAPALDVVSPDLYSPESVQIEANLRLFQRPDNALWIPEFGSKPAYGRFIYAMLGRGAIGVSPFGIDYFNYSNHPLGTQAPTRPWSSPSSASTACSRPSSACGRNGPSTARPAASPRPTTASRSSSTSPAGPPN
jgi:hypothetical protein